MRDCASRLVGFRRLFFRSSAISFQKTFHCERVAESWLLRSASDLSASNCISRCLRRLLPGSILIGVHVDPIIDYLFLTVSIRTCPHCLGICRLPCRNCSRRRGRNIGKPEVLRIVRDGARLRRNGVAAMFQPPPAVELVAADFAPRVRAILVETHRDTYPRLTQASCTHTIALTSFPV